jgi:hypothetical protein
MVGVVMEGGVGADMVACACVTEKGGRVARGVRGVGAIGGDGR